MIIWRAPDQLWTQYGIQAEVLKNQQEDLRKRQAEQAAAAAVAAKAAASAAKPFNKSGTLIHLHDGRSELDDILRQTGGCNDNRHLKTLRLSRICKRPLHDGIMHRRKTANRRRQSCTCAATPVLLIFC